MRDPAATVRRLLALAESPNSYEAAEAMREATRLIRKHGLTDADLAAAPEQVVWPLGPETPETPFAASLVAAVSGLRVGWDPDRGEPTLVAPDLPTAARWSGAYRGIVAQLRERFAEASRGALPDGLFPTPFGPSTSVRWFGPGGFALGSILDPEPEPVRESGRQSYYHGLTRALLRPGGLVSRLYREGRTLALRSRGTSDGPRRASVYDAKVEVSDVAAVARGERDAPRLRLGWEGQCQNTDEYLSRHRDEKKHSPLLGNVSAR